MQDEELNVVEKEEQPDPDEERAWAVLDETLGRIARGKVDRTITEISEAVVILHRGFGLTQNQIADRFPGVSQPTVSNYWSIRPREKGARSGLIQELYERAARREMTLRAAVRASKLSVEEQAEIAGEARETRKVKQELVDSFYKRRTNAVPVFDIPIPETDRQPVVVTVAIPVLAAAQLVNEGVCEFKHQGRTWKFTVEG